MKDSVDFAVCVDYKEDMQFKLSIVITVLKRFLTVTLESFYTPTFIMISVARGKYVYGYDWKKPQTSF